MTLKIEDEIKELVYLHDFSWQMNGVELPWEFWALPSQLAFTEHSVCALNDPGIQLLRKHNGCCEHINHLMIPTNMPDKYLPASSGLNMN